jgi:hypothetical protein
MGRRLRRLLAVPAACVLVAGCGDPGATGEWDGAAVRTLVRRVQEGHPDRDVRVLGHAGGAGGPELPWSVRQALVTAGIEVVAAADAAAAVAEPDVTLLVLERSVREGTEWLVDVRLEDAAVDAAVDAASLRWRVRCVNGMCETVDSTVQAPR